MSEQKRYTAQEMREKSELIGADVEAAAMLRQAADDKEELDKFRNAAKVEVHFDGAEVNEKLALRCEELRKRLEAIVNECEKSVSRFSCTSCRSRCKMDNDIPECENPYLRCEVQNYNAIIRAARGESENENK